MKALLILAALGACSSPTVDTTPDTLPPCDGVEVITVGDVAPGCDLTPPQTLSYRLTDLRPTDAVLEGADLDCLNAGGTPEWSETTLTCRGIDY